MSFLFKKWQNTYSSKTTGKTCMSLIKGSSKNMKNIPVTVKHASFLSPLWNVWGFPKSYSVNRDNDVVSLCINHVSDLPPDTEKMCHIRTVKVFLQGRFKMIDSCKTVRHVFCTAIGVELTSPHRWNLAIKWGIKQTDCRACWILTHYTQLLQRIVKSKTKVIFNLFVH